VARHLHTAQRQRQLRELLTRDHALSDGILLGLDGYVIEVQARAMEVLRGPTPWPQATGVSGMAGVAVREATIRIAGALAKLQIPEPEVSIQINLTPASVLKEGSWLDLPLAIIMLQASGYLPDLPEHREGDYVLMGEVGLHGELRRVPGALSVAYVARSGQTLIVPAGNEKECALITVKPGHENCRVCAPSTLEEVVNFFAGKGKLENVRRNEIRFESAIPKAVDFSAIRGQKEAKEAATIAAAGGHNLLMV
jgi:magnesium chelatase family protein